MWVYFNILKYNILFRDYYFWKADALLHRLDMV
jgi:hypothetical protein